MPARKPPIKITERTVEKLPFAEDAKRPVFYWDQELKGFGVKVTALAKTYFAERKVKGRTVRAMIDSCRVISAQEARTRAAGHLSEMRQNRNPNEERRAEKNRGQTFREVCEEYLVLKPLAERTRADYRRHMGKTLAKWMDKPFLEINRAFVEKEYRAWSVRKAEANSGEGRTLTAAQANQAFRFARAVFTFAKRMRGEDGFPLLKDNPVDALSEGGMWKSLRARSNYIKATQLRAVWEALWKETQNHEGTNKATIRDFLLLMLFAGLRHNEARQLRWVDVDMKEGTLTIPDPKNHQPHTLPFSTYLASLFVSRKQMAGESEWVFPARQNNGAAPIVEYRGVLNAVCESAGVKFTPHDLRRTFLTYTKELPAKYGPFFTKRLANHKVSDVTAGYVQINTAELRKCMDDIADYILKNAGAKTTRIGIIAPAAPPKPRVKRQINLRQKSEDVVKIHN